MCPACGEPMRKRCLRLRHAEHAALARSWDVISGTPESRWHVLSKEVAESNVCFGTAQTRTGRQQGSCCNGQDERGAGLVQARRTEERERRMGIGGFQRCDRGPKWGTGGVRSGESGESLGSRPVRPADGGARETGGCGRTRACVCEGSSRAGAGRYLGICRTSLRDSLGWSRLGDETLRGRRGERGRAFGHQGLEKRAEEGTEGPDRWGRTGPEGAWEEASTACRAGGERGGPCTWCVIAVLGLSAHTWPHLPQESLQPRAVELEYSQSGRAGTCSLR